LAPVRFVVHQARYKTLSVKTGQNSLPGLDPAPPETRADNHLIESRGSERRM
jgi:hypothetical protein